MHIQLLIKISGALLAFALSLLLGSVYLKTREQRRIWKCVRYYGGGAMTSPKPMTESQAVRWLARDVNAEPGHVDRVNGFIFYRPRGGH